MPALLERPKAREVKEWEGFEPLGEEEAHGIISMNNPTGLIDSTGLTCKMIKTIVARLTYYTDNSQPTKSGYWPSLETVAVDSSQYKLKWKSSAKLAAQGCSWNEFDIPGAGRRIAEDTGGDVHLDHLDVWFPDKSQGQSFLSFQNSGKIPGRLYNVVTVYECTE